jgi:hypothetical protein
MVGVSGRIFAPAPTCGENISLRKRCNLKHRYSKIQPFFFQNFFAYFIIGGTCKGGKKGKINLSLGHS